MQRIIRHPILDIKETKEFVITVDGRELVAHEGETIAATLLAHGITVFRHTKRFHEPRGIFCGIGQCTDCIMEVNGQPNIRTCVTMVEPNMTIKTQQGISGGEVQA